MIIFKCRVTGDEMISDAYKPADVIGEDGEPVPELMEVESLTVAKDGGAIDVGCGDAFGGGAEEADDAVEKVNNVIDDSIGFGYNEVPMGKKDFKDFLKEYCGKVRGLLKEDDKIAGPDVKAFTQGAPAFCKWLLSKYDDLQFYMSPSFNPEGAMVMSYYKDGASNPTFVYIKKGLIEEKC